MGEGSLSPFIFLIQGKKYKLNQEENGTNSRKEKR